MAQKKAPAKKPEEQSTEMRRFKINPEIYPITSLCFVHEVYPVKDNVIDLPKLPEPCWYSHLVNAGILVEE